MGIKKMFNYSEELKDHFKNPRNWGKIEDAEGVGIVENPSCGDKVWMYIKVEKGIINDIKFQTTGCAPVVATSSMITEMAKGKTVEEALEISKTDVEEKAGKLPPIKMYGPNLAAMALKAALEDYIGKNK
ncbi:MAG: iron-sulfur cluster assembly scaffold protein [Candidatus Hydrothermarchaeales archaeon]